MHQALSRQEVETLLNRLKEGNGKIEVQDRKVTCSIGVIPLAEDKTVEDLYRSADRMLYEAKKKGKNQFVFEK